MQTERTDWELVDRTRAGDDAAFGALMGRHKVPVVRFVYRMLGDTSDAEDVAQDVFVRAYRHIRKPGFRNTGARFSTWLFQVARNAALDSLRWRKRHPSESLAEIEDRGGTPAAAGRTPPEESAARETGAQIAAAVALLPEDQRAALVLSEYEGLSNAEVAAAMRCTVKSVEGRLFRARGFLRQRLRHLIA